MVTRSDGLQPIYRCTTSGISGRYHQGVIARESGISFGCHLSINSSQVTIGGATSSMFRNPWVHRAHKFLAKQIFFFWTAFLTYTNGPYYTMLEFFRHHEWFGIRKLNYDEEFSEPLDGKVCVMTGGTRGIGLEVVRFLFSKNCKIITGTSTLSKDAPSETVDRYRERLLAQLVPAHRLRDQATKSQLLERLLVFPLDLSTMDSVVAFAQQVKQTGLYIDYLICNGGVMFVPHRITVDRFEGHMATNYYSHCLLVVKLLSQMHSLDSAPPPRIVLVSSGAHHASFGLRLHDLQSTQLNSIYHGYAQSKLALIMFTYRFNQWLARLEKANCCTTRRPTINTLHPGVCRTGLMENFNFFKFKFIQDMSWLFRSAKEGAETILYTALSPAMSDTSGQYFENCLPARSSKLSYDTHMQTQLWMRTWQDLKPWLSESEYTSLLTTAPSNNNNHNNKNNNNN